MDNKQLKDILAWIIRIAGIVLGLFYFIPAFSTKKESISALTLLTSGKIKLGGDSGSKRYSMHPELLLLMLIPVAIAVIWFLVQVNKDKIYFLVGTVAGAFVTVVLWFVFGAEVDSISSKISQGPLFVIAIILSILYLLVTVAYLLMELGIIDIAKLTAGSGGASAQPRMAQPAGQPYGAPGQPQPIPMAQPYGAPGQPQPIPMAQPYGAPGQPQPIPMAQPYGMPQQPQPVPMAQPYGMPQQQAPNVAVPVAVPLAAAQPSVDNPYAVPATQPYEAQPAADDADEYDEDAQTDAEASEEYAEAIPVAEAAEGYAEAIPVAEAAEEYAEALPVAEAVDPYEEQPSSEEYDEEAQFEAEPESYEEEEQVTEIYEPASAPENLQPILAEPVIEDPAPQQFWVCPQCGRDDNAGNFCKACGTRRP